MGLIFKSFARPKKIDPYIIKTFRVGCSVVKVLSDDTIWEYNIGTDIPINFKKWRELK